MNCSVINVIFGCPGLMAANIETSNKANGGYVGHLSDENGAQ